MFIKFYDHIINSDNIAQIGIDRYTGKGEGNSIYANTFLGEMILLADAEGRYSIGLMRYYLQKIFNAIQDDEDIDLDRLSRHPIPLPAEMRREGLSEWDIETVMKYKEEREREAEEFSFGRGET